MYCPECGAMPAQVCRFVGTPGTTRPGSTSAKVLAARAVIGMPTVNPHQRRLKTPFWRMRDWLRDNYDIFTTEDT
jgi:hypothetical protein